MDNDTLRVRQNEGERMEEKKNLSNRIVKAAKASGRHPIIHIDFNPIPALFPTKKKRRMSIE